MQDPAVRRKARFIPVGSNVPERWKEAAGSKAGEPAVAVFGVTDGRGEETLLAEVVGRAAEQVGPLRLVVLGRGARQAEPALRAALDGRPVRLEVHGVLPPAEVSDRLASADVQLFVRGGVSTRRTSAIAGLACGLPIVGFAGRETSFPITEAGVQLVPVGDVDGLARELVEVLRDRELREHLARRSREAVQQYFSWAAIANRYLEMLGIPQR